MVTVENSRFGREWRSVFEIFTAVYSSFTLKNGEVRTHILTPTLKILHPLIYEFNSRLYYITLKLGKPFKGILVTRLEKSDVVCHVLLLYSVD